MDFTGEPLEASWRRAALVGLLAALALYTLLLARHVGAVAGGSDSSGYMNHAKMLASERLHVQPRTVPGLDPAAAPPFLYVPLGFKPAWNGDGIVPTYPTGFPLFVVAASTLAGWRHAGDLAIVLNALLGVLATYGLCRALGLGRGASTLGTAIVALSPLYVFMSLQAMSDVPSLAWTSLAVLAALRSRSRASWALAAGAATAVDVLLRPTNVLAFIPVAIALGTSPRRWVLLALGGLPGAVFFGAHSLAAYGSLATTGYGDNSQAFLARYVPGTLLHYLVWLPVLFTPLSLLFAGLPWVRGLETRSKWLLGAWVGAYGAFYSTYECTHQTWWYLRFLLPAAPALVAGGLLVARPLFERAPRWADPGRSVGAATLAALLVLASSFEGNRRLYTLTIGSDELRYPQLAQWMDAHVPAGAVCLAMQASGSLFYYTHYTFLRWDVLDARLEDRVEKAARASGRPLYAVLFPFEITEGGAFARKLRGRWQQVGKVQDVTIWRRDFAADTP